MLVYLWYVCGNISASYFLECISEQDLDEMNIEIIRNTLYKVRIGAQLVAR